MSTTEESARHPRRTSSKYDFVKVKVWIGANSDHYYVLSRFLVSRMLTVTKISNVVAIKIALELKKLLVDNNLLDVSQADLEANLFKLMQKRGYGEEYVNRYKMMTNFHHQRVPLLVLVGGTACVGKSTIATQLAQRLNLPNVLQTDIIYELLRTDPNNAAPLNATPLWGRTDLTSTEDLMQEFRRECRVIRKGVDGDLNKTMSEGKPLIMEGLHLDPGIYLTELPQARIGRPATSKHQKVHRSETLGDQKVSPRLRTPTPGGSCDVETAKTSGRSGEEGRGGERESGRENKSDIGREQNGEALASQTENRPLGSGPGEQPQSVDVNSRRDGSLQTSEAHDVKQKRAKGRMRTHSLAEAKEFLKSLGRSKSRAGVKKQVEPKDDVGMKFLSKSASSGYASREPESRPAQQTQSQPSIVFQRALRSVEHSEASDRNGARLASAASIEDRDTAQRATGKDLHIRGSQRSGAEGNGVRGEEATGVRASESSPGLRGEQSTGVQAPESSPPSQGPEKQERCHSESRWIGREEPLRAPGREEPGGTIATESDGLRRDKPAGVEASDSAAVEASESAGEKASESPAGSHPPVGRFERNANGDTESAELRREEPIVVPIVLRMSEEDHRALIEEWLASRSGEVGDDVKLDKTAVLRKLRAIQDYLCSFEDQGVAVVDVSTTSFAQTLDWLHSYLLECIDDGRSEAEG